jgi:TrmH family RNA methyltransferase
VAAFSDRLAEDRIGALGDRARRGGARVLVVADEVAAAMSPVRHPSGVVAIAGRPRATLDDVLAPVPQMVIVLNEVQDPGNVGAIVRVAEACGATGVLATGGSADPFGWKALRGSMGSALRVPIALEPDEQAALGDAVSRGCRIAAAVPRDGDPLFAADLSGPLAIVLGAEGRGLSPALAAAAHLRITIPMTPPVESLNTAVSAALLLYEAMRQRHAVRQPALRQGR